MPLQLDDLAALDAPTLENTGLPLSLPVDAIDEDPAQPRREFDANALQALAETIRARGVRQPISVRPHLQQGDRWILNFGARRLRAARLAELAEIPAFIDTTADSYDQVIENEQREGLKPLELALFVQKRLAQGDNQAEIAKRLGKSRQWVTLTTALIEAPDWLLQAYREGRCRGLNELYELRRLHGEQPQAVAAWVASEAAITRERIAAFKDSVGVHSVHGNAAAVKAGRGPERVEPRPEGPRETPAKEAATPNAMPGPEPCPRTAKRIHVEFDGIDYQLVVSVAPPQAGHVYVRPLNGGPRRLAPAADLKLLGFVGG